MMKIDYLFIINIDYITDYITRAIYSPVFCNFFKQISCLLLLEKVAATADGRGQAINIKENKTDENVFLLTYFAVLFVPFYRKR